MMPRLAILNSPSKLNARGSLSLPYSRDFAIVDVARQFGGILVFLVFRLERADANAIFFAQDEPFHADILDDARPVAVVFLEPLLIHEPAKRIEFAADLHAISLLAASIRRWPGIEFVLDLFPETMRDQVQRLFVHRAPVNGIRVVGLLFAYPAKRIKRPVVGGRVPLQPCFSSRAMVLLLLPTGPCSSSTRRSMP